MTEISFIIDRPRFDPETGEARFTYGLSGHRFTEILRFPRETLRPAVDQTAAFRNLLDLTAAVLGVSYFKLLAPFDIDATALSLTAEQHRFLIDVYENGLGEFYARNDLKRFGRLRLAGDAVPPHADRPELGDRTLVLIGGGKDSLVSVQLLEAAGAEMTLFAVNPKGPILSSAERSGHPLIAVERVLDPEMIALNGRPGYYNGHVPSTAINSMIAALAALLYGYSSIVLSNERSASEGNIEFDGREANHQYSKSLDFERAIRDTLASATGGALAYFSLLRPYSEARIARLFARSTRYDDVFSSCNRNFRLAGHDGSLWCGQCPKCHFVFLIFAPEMTRDRLIKIFGRNVLDDPAAVAPYRELTGLSGHKPWECVGEILEAAACLWRIAGHPDWRDAIVVKTLRPELEAFYGAARLEAAHAELMADSAEHLIPASVENAVAPHAH
ncbi:endonuclease domain-containing protein [Pelagibacterium lacus]|uniref:UDP-N-acetyl-alpha-D-muramoyl-L-alanyl-L-glutamate epimerase n=1 Tax=Pelagibacterium lacus TaxID=2282655 RepID=A0A369W3Z3_9HYPH|nr:endonuclease domain-containing protein [Pelagibacterium lacus]RDE08727.1 endonuclease domain-containing protein [Pelagibacterium lacus]